MKRVGILVFSLPLIISCAVAEDSLQALSRILVSKGLITAAEYGQVTHSASTNELVSLLLQKGLLTREEALRIVESPEVSVIPAVHRLPQTQPVPQTPPPAEAQAPPPVAVYGTILWNAFYNSNATNNQDVPLFPAKRNADALDNFGMTVRQSRVGLRFQGPTLAGATVRGQVETDFFGGKTGLPNGISMDQFRLRLGYVRLDWSGASVVAGQDWSIFAPLNPTSLAGFAIPDMSAAGNPWIRTPQIRIDLQRKISTNARLLWSAAAADPNTGDHVAGPQAVRSPGIGEHGAMPAIETRLAAAFRTAGRDGGIGGSARYNRGTNVGTIAGSSVERSVDSWGAAFDYSVPLHSRFAVMGELYRGRALGAFSVGLGQSVLPVGTLGEHGVEARGGWFQAQFDVTRKWQANTVYGIELPDVTELRTGDRSKTQGYMFNLMFKASPRFTLAWEWRRLLANYKNQPAANSAADHANVAVSYGF